jgi:hypothetical protein
MQAVAIQERTNLELHNELIKKAEDLIPVLKARSEAANEDKRNNSGFQRCWLF